MRTFSNQSLLSTFGLLMTLLLSNTALADQPNWTCSFSKGMESITVNVTLHDQCGQATMLRTSQTRLYSPQTVTFNTISEDSDQLVLQNLMDGFTLSIDQSSDEYGEHHGHLSYYGFFENMGCVHVKGL